MQQPAVSIPWPGGTYLFLYVLFIALQLGEFVFVQVVPVIHGHVVLIVVLRRLVQAKEQKQLLRSTNINCVPNSIDFQRMRTQVPLGVRESGSWTYLRQVVPYACADRPTSAKWE